MTDANESGQGSSGQGSAPQDNIIFSLRIDASQVSAFIQTLKEGGELQVDLRGVHRSETGSSPGEAEGVHR